MKISQLNTQSVLSLGPSADPYKPIEYSKLIINYKETNSIDETPVTKQISIDDVGQAIIAKNHVTMFRQGSQGIPDSFTVFTGANNTVSDISIDSIIGRNILTANSAAGQAVDDLITSHITYLPHSSTREIAALNSIIASVISDPGHSSYSTLHSEIAQHILDISNSTTECNAINDIICSYISHNDLGITPSITTILSLDYSGCRIPLINVSNHELLWLDVSDLVSAGFFNPPNS